MQHQPVERIAPAAEQDIYRQVVERLDAASPANDMQEPSLDPADIAALQLSARLEPFDTYWQGSRDLSREYDRFDIYYRANYLPRLPADRDAAIAVLSCGPGYLVNSLVKAGYRNVIGVDADPEKVALGLGKGLPCAVGSAMTFLAERPESFDVIIPEQELNHLTIDETITFLQVARRALRPNGQILVYAVNGANPLVSPEHISHNIDHFYNVTEYSLRQLMQLGGFTNIEPFECKLYVFWNRPENYVGWVIVHSIEFVCRLIYRLYGKDVKILSKRIGATANRLP